MNIQEAKNAVINVARSYLDKNAVGNYIIFKDM